MRLGIIGGGVVGRATARAFIEHVDEVRVYDILKERRTHDLLQTLASDLVFVCLPTPMKVGGGCDVSALDDFFGSYQKSLVCFALRSTVPVGTTSRLRNQYRLLNLVHSPEFLTARCAVTDAQLPARNIIGDPWGVDATGNLAAEALYNLYSQRFPGVPIHEMSSDESETVKLVLNSFFALKIAYWNTVKQFTDHLSLRWDKVMQGVLTDGRISYSHIQVPGPDGRPGFGGACLRKDLNNLLCCFVEADLSGDLLRVTQDYNEFIRGEE